MKKIVYKLEIWIIVSKISQLKLEFFQYPVKNLIFSLVYVL